MSAWAWSKHAAGSACSLIFFALSTAVVIVIRRPWYEKVLILLSAIPIALIVNIIRITVTGVMHKTVGHEIADRVFHDLAGWLMMPLALALVWLELRLFGWVLKDRIKPEAPPLLFYLGSDATRAAASTSLQSAAPPNSL